MEAKDTVMSDKQLDQYCKDKVGHQAHVPNSHDRKEAQAEISFPAGMQEVRKWIDKAFKIYFSNTHEDPCIRHKAVMALTGAWQAFLKERGLEK